MFFFQLVLFVNVGPLFRKCAYNSYLNNERFIQYKNKYENNPIFPFFFRRYPKPGTQNPIASLKIADLADPKNFRIRDIKPPAFLINEWVQFQPPFFRRFSP